MMQKLARVTPILLLLVLAACNSAPAASPTATVSPSPTPGGYQTLTIDAFADILAKNKSQYKVVNVHIPYEGEIEGTDSQVAYNNLDALMSALPDRDAQIILYCRSGSMSAIASRALAEKGYTRVFDVPGGMVAWEASGRKLINR